MHNLHQKFRSPLALVFSATLMACIAGTASSQVDSSVTKVQKAEENYRAAVLQNDLTYFAQHISPEYVGVDPDGSVMNAAALLAARKTHVYNVHRVDVVHQEIHVSRDTAVVSECLAVDALKNGKQIETTLQISRVWQNIDGRWIVLSFQGTPRAKPCEK